MNPCLRLVVIGLAFLAASGARSAVVAAQNSPPYSATAAVLTSPDSAAAAVLTPPDSAAAAVLTPPDSATATAPEWQYEFTPYLWLIGLDGTLTIGPREEEFTASFSDLFAKLRLGLMGVFEARRGQWGLIADGMYFDLGETAAGPGPGGGTIEAGVTEQLYSAAGFWRALDRPAVTLDLIVGARYGRIAADFSIAGGPRDGESRSGSRYWVDAIAGGRAAYRIAPRWRAAGYLEAGAGGSDFTWQALGAVDFQLTNSLAARGGYRYLSIDGGTDRFDCDLAMGGFLLGLGIGF